MKVRNHFGRRSGTILDVAGVELAKEFANLNGPNK